MKSFIRGVRSGLSLCRTNPGAAISAVTALAMGIGFSTTMFSIVHGGTRSLPFEDADAIVAIQRVATGGGTVPSSTVRDFNHWARGAQSFEALGAFQTDSTNLSGEGDVPERVSAAALTPGTFELLRVQPASGRSFLPSDAVPGAEPVAVLSNALWRRRYSADASVLGRRIRLDGVSHTVIGVMPAGFGFPLDASLWTAVRTGDSSADGEAVQVFGRLTRGAGHEAARTELLTMARAAAETDPARAAIGLNVVDFIELETPPETVWGLYLLLIAVSGVLIIACVNVANLFIVRAVARSRDVAVRLALGAGRRMIVVEQMSESLVLSSLASIAGVAIAWAGTRAFRLGTADILSAFWMDFSLDTTVLAYASVLAIAAAAAAAIVPALRASRTDIVSTLRDGGAGSSSLKIGRLSRGLLSGQVAMACALLAFTLLLGQAAVAIHARAWPFDPDKVLTAQIGLPLAALDDNETRERVLVQLEDAIDQLPGAHASALASSLPGRGSGNWSFAIDSVATEPSRLLLTGVTMVSTNYFETIGTRVLSGRGLTKDDRPGTPAVAVVNESFVSRYSRDRDPLGRRIFLGKRELTIVGIVEDALPRDIDEADQNGVYVSIHQLRPYAIRVVVAAAADPMPLVRALRASIDRVNPDWPIFEAFTAREAALREKQVLDVLSRLFGIFGSGALLLTAIGLYSVTAFAVALRRRELGIRVALGATRGDLLRMLGLHGGRQLMIGLTVGTLLAVLLTRAFKSAVELNTANDGLIIATVVIALFVTATAAIAAPVLRASTADPVKILRE
jgi:putative ABC transport system permease protein